MKNNFKIKIYKQVFNCELLENNKIVIIKHKNKKAFYNYKTRQLSGDFLETTRKIKTLLFRRLKAIKKELIKKSIYYRQIKDFKRLVNTKDAGKQRIKQKVKMIDNKWYKNNLGYVM